MLEGRLMFRQRGRGRGPRMRFDMRALGGVEWVIEGSLCAGKGGVLESGLMCGQGGEWVLEKEVDVRAKGGGKKRG